MKLCGRCKENKSLDSFRKKGDGLQSYCSECDKEYARLRYQQKKIEYQERNKRNIKHNRDFLIAYLKNHSCVDCGETDIVVLEFDHINDKSKGVTQLCHSGYSLKRIQDEIAKCEVVCANCHKRRTYKRCNSYRTW